MWDLSFEARKYLTQRLALSFRDGNGWYQEKWSWDKLKIWIIKT